MSTSPHRRWYQFSLKAMMVVMTLAAAILGRCAYLRERFLFHRNQYELQRKAIREEFPALLTLVNKSIENDNLGLIGVPPYPQELDAARANEDMRMRQMHYHETVASRHYSAMYRPWTIVDETTSEDP